MEKSNAFDEPESEVNDLIPLSLKTLSALLKMERSSGTDKKINI